MAFLAPMDSQTTEETEIQFPVIDPLDSGPNRTRLRLIIIFGCLAAVTATWLYIIFGYRPELLIDELADKTFPKQAEQICAAAQDQLAALPYASQARTADERADVVAQSNVILRDMLDELDPLAPTSPPKAKEAVSEWLGDWRTYLGDRETYVENLRKDSKARFLETPKGNDKGITRAITSFAQVNSMTSCATPSDVS